MVAVAITQNFAINQAMTEALDHLELEPLLRGKRVAVKPNDTWASAEDTTAVTQPDTLRAVLRYVQQFRPHELVVTGGRVRPRLGRSSALRGSSTWWRRRVPPSSTITDHPSRLWPWSISPRRTCTGRRPRSW